MNTKTIQKNNTMQFRPTMVELSSYYFATSNRKFHSSKIMRVLFVDTDKNQQSNIFSYYGVNPYKKVITLLIEEVEGFYDDKDYKIILLNNNKLTQLKAGVFAVRYKDYQQAKKELNRLEEELKTSLDCLDSFINLYGFTPMEYFLHKTLR